MAYPKILVDWATKVYQAANGTAPKPNLEEISANASHLFAAWPLVPFNPDTLIGRKSMLEYEKMRADDQVKGALSLKKGSVLSTGWKIEAVSDDAKDQEARDFVEYELTHLDALYGSFDDHLYEIMSALDFGFSITEIVYLNRDDGPFAGKVGLRTLKTRKPHQFRFRVDKHDNLFPDGILQSQVRYPIDKFLIFSYQREFGNWFGTSDLRAAYRPWWLKENTMRWWGIFNERFGIPITIGSYPVNTAGASIETLRTMLENIQANTAFTVPETFKIELREASGRGANIFQLTVEAMDKAISRAILVPSLLGLSEQAGVGSYSQARKHFDVFLIIIDDLRRDISEDVINNQLIPRLVNINYAVEDHPRFVFEPFTKEDTVELFNAWMSAVASGVVIPVPQDEIHVRSLTDFPERSLEDIEAEREKIRLEQERKIQEEEDRRAAEEAARLEKERIGKEDLEGQTGLPKDPREEPGPVPPQLQASRGYVRTRSTNKFEKKINFQRIETGLGSIETDATDRLTIVIEKQRESLIGVTTKKQEAGTLSAEFIQTLDLKHKAEMTRINRSFLQETYRFGRSEGRSMFAAKMQTRVTQGLPPDDALQFFEDKSFHMTGVYKDRMIGVARNILFNALKTGEATPTTVEKLRAAFEPFLGDPLAVDDLGKQLTPHRLNTIVRTNSTEAFNEGLKHSLDQEVADGDIIGWEYSAILDGRQTDICEHLDELIFKPDSPSLQAMTPPNHFNCRSVLIPVPVEEAPVRFITEEEVGKAEDLKGDEF